MKNPVTTTTGMLVADQKSIKLASDLMAHLAALFPAIASQTRSESGARAWVAAWSRQMQLVGLTQEHVMRGLSRLHELPNDQPLSWPAFYNLCCDPWRDVDNKLFSKDERDRKLLEFIKKHPGAKFANGRGKELKEKLFASTSPAPAAKA